MKLFTSLSVTLTVIAASLAATPVKSQETPVNLSNQNQVMEQTESQAKTEQTQQNKCRRGWPFC